MPKLQPIQLEDGSVIYVEATDDIQAVSPSPYDSGNGAAYPSEPTEETTRTSKGWHRPNPNNQMAQSFQAIESTIKTYTQYTLNAFRDAAMADVKRVTLEFGVNVSGVGGVPYIATGTAGCNIKVVVECAFPERTAPEAIASQVAPSPAAIPPAPASQPFREPSLAAGHHAAHPPNGVKPPPPPRSPS
ncbi:MAG: hypothetical protein Fur0046_06410 [Cyanobacteria bacterium J069]